MKELVLEKECIIIDVRSPNSLSLLMFVCACVNVICMYENIYEYKTNFFKVIIPPPLFFSHFFPSASIILFCPSNSYCLLCNSTVTNLLPDYIL